ncbi:unnamed protein product [Brassica oleracea]
MILKHGLVLNAYLFFIGLYGLFTSRNMVRVAMCLELILNAVNMNLVTFADFFDYSQLISTQLKEDIFYIFVIAITATEATIGLAIVLSIYRNRKSSCINQSTLVFLTLKKEFSRSHISRLTRKEEDKHSFILVAYIGHVSLTTNIALYITYILHTERIFINFISLCVCIKLTLYIFLTSGE